MRQGTRETHGNSLTPMLNPTDIAHAVDRQQRSYRLLLWMAGGVERGFIRFDTAQANASFPEAAEQWIARHFHEIPPDARPEQSDLPAFAAHFSTYLENSFVLIREPGRWLVDAPNLRTKKPSRTDRRRAREMKLATVRNILTAHNAVLADDVIDGIVDDPDLRKTISLVAYAYDLLDRMKGIAAGSAVLVLWHGFAWTRKGSRKKNFRLSAQAILKAERELCEVVLKAAREQRD